MISQDKEKTVVLTAIDPVKLINLPQNRDGFLDVTIYVSGLEDTDEVKVINFFDNENFMIDNLDNPAIINTGDADYPNPVFVQKDFPSRGKLKLAIRAIGGGAPTSVSVKCTAIIDDTFLSN